jgi:Uma2 family endonuclease
MATAGTPVSTKRPMTNLVLDDQIRIPAWINDLGSFRRWTKSDEYPERGDFAYLNGDLRADLTMETFLHNQIKSLFVIVLGGIVLSERLGRYCGDRMRLVNVMADISVEPDGMFVSQEAIKSRRVRLEEGVESLEVIGTPDMVLEVVSASSVRKDTVELRELYARAGIAEYWLVDGPKGQLTFDILRLTSKGYVASRKAAGWVKSPLFGRSFRLVEEDGTGELPEYRLHVR